MAWPIGRGDERTGASVNTLTCVAVGMTALTLAACHVASRQEDGAAAGMAPDRTTFVMAQAASPPAIFETDAASSADRPAQRSIVVTAIHPRQLDLTALSGEDVDDCKAWSLSPEDAEAFFAMSETVDANSWREDFDDAPCTISGTVQRDGVEWQFSINGAVKATLRHGTTVRYVGCELHGCEAFGA